MAGKSGLLGRLRVFATAAALIATGLLALVPSMTVAQTYPNRPIRLLHGFAAGGAADTLARIVSEGLSKRLGQPVIVEAKPGAGGNIAAAAVANAAPDGYTLGLVTGAHAISGALYKTLAYHPTDSFEMVSTLVYYALVVAVRADHPAKTLPDLIALAKQKPDEISFGSVGFGSTHHLAGELLNTTAGIKMVHVPYRGDAPSATALLGGEVPVIVGTTVLLAGQIESGAIRGLAVTSPTRTGLLPNVPSVAEAGLEGYDVRTWAGLLAPKGTPADIVTRLNREVASMLGDPAVKKALETATGGEARGSTSEDMRILIRAEIAKWSKVIDEAKIPRID
ncbi:tripartite tricarboxylate transporter substrate binding protein [Bradyrhizobium manausense]|uniref:tripartite tricarboxylate transporter substrate binding protein n=2 Tax=Bradyrhizobium TaxID=374 RepID=UPI001BA488A6|nr:tripartite tricarboxylate transporter substrate binding protein [Bradyrhizobium arachidis]MBR0830004.1 tripartite tricarboxylate transporter substrate binding protein [Bradyrhizobium manausense]UVO27739.1 tripartite tricarboxylate transporter substrate binding protein [Bradyrhizobium arachidis]